MHAVYRSVYNLRSLILGAEGCRECCVVGLGVWKWDPGPVAIMTAHNGEIKG